MVSSKRDVIAMVVNMVQDRPIPSPGEATSPLYKILVRKIRQQLKEVNERMDFIEVEMMARRMAGWVEELSKEATKRSLSNIQARKVVTSEKDIQVEEDADKENILLVELPKESSLLLERTGEKVWVIDEDGSKVIVEGIVSNNSEKTLVTKQSPDGNCSTWIVQVASKNPIKSQEDAEMKEIQNNIKNAKDKMSESEWKSFVKTFIRKSDLKKRLRNFNPESLSAAEIRSILLPLIKSISSELKEYDNSDPPHENKKQNDMKSKESSMSPKPPNISSKRDSRPTKIKRLKKPHRDATPSFHNHVN